VADLSQYVAGDAPLGQVAAEVLELVIRVVGGEGAQREPDHLGCLDWRWHIHFALPVRRRQRAGGGDERGPRELSILWGRGC
jgi:hypothetical protein